MVDIATGEGSLTELALFKSKPACAHLVALDLSKSMLLKAYARFRKKAVTLIRGDVMKLPFQDQRIPLMTCFGGLNSFPDFDQALAEMLQKLSPGGRLRGSFLLLPQAKWRQNQIQKWIKKAYQTITLTEVDAKKRMRLVSQKNRSRISEWQCVGDVLLFEILKEAPH